MIQGQIRFTRMENVWYGRPAADAIATEAGRRGAERVFIIASKSLNEQTDEITQVEAALGARHAGTFTGIPAHSPRDSVIECAKAASAAGADLLVTFGGGSVTDATKVVQICLKHKVFTVEGLDAYHVRTTDDGKTTVPEFDAPDVRQITVPTTLSGGEFNMLGGCTDQRTKVKQGYTHPGLVPASVILDPAPTRHTPVWLWLSTGVRAVDHCVEAYCSGKSNPFVDGNVLQALRLLSSGLPASKADPSNMEARLDCLMGAWLSMTGVIGGGPMGASHAIGHILGGTCDVPHGYTSCVMLPNVLEWNKGVNGDRQADVATAFGRPGVPAAKVLHEFIAGLGMPRSLTEVGIGEDQFDLIAKNSMHDRWLHLNPRKVNGVDDVIEILRMAA
ncbi:MAG: iron-containing alcohol dehydrogenase [Alphaproteobacteria bacterium]